MATFRSAVAPRHLGVVALIFGILGAVFYFWAPFGLVLALAGLILGIVGWSLAPPRSNRVGLLIVATFISLAALIFDLIIIADQLEIIRFTALR